VRVLDLCSGIGGFSLGLERAGMKTVAFCEIEPYPQAVLRKHWPEVPIYDDIKKLTAARLAADGITGVDVVTGGIPCQPFSVAGKQRGKEDNRHLWPEMLRIVQEFDPTWVIVENVVGFVSMALDDVCFDLEAASYEVQSFVIPACATDAPQRRDRVWIVAHSAKLLRYGSNHNARGCTCFKPVPKLGNRSRAKVVADTQRIGQSGQGQPKQPVYSAEDFIRETNRLDYGSKGGFRPWPVEPGVGRVVDGIPAGMDRLKGLGNAVVPQIPEIIGRAIIQIERTKQCS